MSDSHHAVTPWSSAGRLISIRIPDWESESFSLSLSAWAGLVSPRTGLKGPTSVIEEPILFNPMMPWTRVSDAHKMETSPSPINGPGWLRPIFCNDQNTVVCQQQIACCLPFLSWSSCRICWLWRKIADPLKGHRRNPDFPCTLGPDHRQLFPQGGPDPLLLRLESVLSFCLQSLETSNMNI